MKQQFETLVKEMGEAGTSAGLPADLAGAQPTTGAAGPSSASAAAGGADESFQETIRKTMERMQASDTQTTAAATSDAVPSDDMLAELLKQMQAGGDGGGAGGAGAGEEDFSAILLGMMEQLTNREILYEPMRELHAKYPAWLAAHADTAPAADLVRYREQQALVAEIVGRFQAPAYSDDNAHDREFIVERMQKVCGFPFSF